MPVGTNVWSLRTEVVLKALDNVLAMRKYQLRTLGLPEDEAYMPFTDGQKLVQARLYEQWLKSDDAQNAREAAARALEALAPAQGKHDPGSDLSSRTLKSYYRRAMMRAWGSMEWLHAFIALGQLPSDFVAIMRRNTEERRALAPAQGKDPRQLKRGERTEPELGLQHKKSEAKQLRDRGKLLDKQIMKQNEMWAQGKGKCRSCLPPNAWRRLLDEADGIWKIATKVSYEAGFPFKDRKGIKRNDGPRDLVGLSLRAWTWQNGLHY